jgi:hypothetical protein
MRVFDSMLAMLTAEKQGARAKRTLAMILPDCFALSYLLLAASAFSGGLLSPSLQHSIRSPQDRQYINLYRNDGSAPEEPLQ